MNSSSNPSGVAVDSFNDHVYWVDDDSSNKVSRCNLDGTNVVVFASLASHIFTIRLDLKNRYDIITHC